MEHIDDEGDTVLTHCFMTPQQALDLLEAMRSEGAFCTICDLSGTPDAPIAVLSEGGTGQMG